MEDRPWLKMLRGAGSCFESNGRNWLFLITTRSNSSIGSIPVPPLHNLQGVILRFPEIIAIRSDDLTKPEEFPI
jgi:hypothetical protein